MTTPADASPPTQPGDGPLGATIRRGFALSLGNQLVVRLLTFATGVLLARLLSPREYGLFAVAQLLHAAMILLDDLGVGVAVVQWPEPVQRFAPTVSTLTVIVTLALSSVAFTLSGSIAAWMQAPAATPLIRAVIVIGALDAIIIVPTGIIARRFLQGTRAAIDVTSSLLSSATAVVLALSGFGAWSLVLGYLAASITVTVMTLVLAPVKPAFGFDRTVAKELLRFGMPVTAAGLLVFALLNSDYFIIGRVLGPVELGVYTIAFNLCSIPVNVISTSVRRIAVSGFARVHEAGGGTGEALIRAWRGVVVITAPVCLLLALFALPGIRLVYGTKWLAAAAVLPWLALLGFFRVAFDMVHDYLIAVGRNRANVVLHALWVMVLVPALAFGALRSGTVGVGIAHAAVAAAVVMPAVLFILHRAGVPIVTLLARTALPLLPSLALAGIALLIRRTGTPDLVQLALGGVAGALAVGLPLLAVRSGRFGLE